MNMGPASGWLVPLAPPVSTPQTPIYYSALSNSSDTSALGELALSHVCATKHVASVHTSGEAKRQFIYQH